jgi:hypothetical protein
VRENASGKDYRDTLDLHPIDLSDGRQVFLEVLKSVCYARLLHVGERCGELCWSAIRFGCLLCVSGFVACQYGGRTMAVKVLRLIPSVCDCCITLAMLAKVTLRES